jgi:hypothetical protein
MHETATSYIRTDYLSLWLGRAVAAAIAHDASGHILAEARTRLTWLRTINQHAGSYYDAWEQALNDGAEAVISLLCDTSEAAQPIRSSSPFTGALSQDERSAVLAAFDAWWNAQPHDGDFLLSAVNRGAAQP